MQLISRATCSERVRLDLTSQLWAFAPYGPANASVRSRLLDWLPRLGIENAEVLLGGLDPFGIRAQWRSRGIPAGATRFVLRNAAKLSRGSLEARILRGGAPGVYDIDDGLPWDDGTLPGLGAVWKRPWPRSLIALRAATAADRVIAGNDILAEWAEQHCRDVVVIPTCVEPANYASKRSWEASATPRIGWIGTAATEPYLLDIAPALTEIHRATGAILTVLSGPGDVHPSLAPFTERVVWTIERQHSMLASWDVGIMPLRDGRYERAKCAYKLLQYGAAGLPAVGTPIGASRMVLHAFGADSPTTNAEWVDSLLHLITGPAAARKQLGERSAQVVSADYSYDAWEPTWRAAVFDR